MILYRTEDGARVEMADGVYAPADSAWDDLLKAENLAEVLRQADEPAERGTTLSPVTVEEVWAAGVTYYRSRTARMDESKESGGSSFYDKVYQAERPELFMKATPHRVVGHGQPLKLREDSNWMVPEPELTLWLSPAGAIRGYTIGNDLSSRDIEGENPLYLPQAKTFDGCASIGPGILIQEEPMAKETAIELTIFRDGESVFSGSTQLSQMKQTLENIVAYLFRAASFPQGCFLMTGTGIVPPDDFTLKSGDRVDISIEGIGTLSNPVE
ncbi:MAG: fumarylacetoacetate hydrolase family protein [Verrucomicrobiota bacterium]